MSLHSNEKEEKKILSKKLDFNNDINNNLNNKKKDKIIFESKALINEISNIYKKAKKFDYNFESINVDFNDFINHFSFENNENKNIMNIPNNVIYSFSNENITQRKGIGESFTNSNSSQTMNNTIENNPIYSGKYIVLENGKKQINKDLIKCNCKNSSCLKFYCECFANGKCCENCPCCNCKNKPEFENLRQEKYKNIIMRNPKAIQQINSTKKSWTCNCKNSNCKKKYCDCFQNGKNCTSKCKCLNCLNKTNNINYSNGNNSGEMRKVKRIRGGKKLLKNNKFITPKKRNGKRSNNQSTEAFTEYNNKTDNFNNLSNKLKFKEIRQKLNMNNN
jgi:hypothetical protein